jgi:hypothetical protein
MRAGQVSSMFGEGGFSMLRHILPMLFSLATALSLGGLSAGDELGDARAKATLERMQGAWTEGKCEDLLTVVVKGDRIEWHMQVLKVKIVKFDGDIAHADAVVEEGPGKGEMYTAILCVGTETIHWCITSDSERPTEFKTVPMGVTRYVAWKKVKEQPAPMK